MRQPISGVMLWRLVTLTGSIILSFYFLNWWITFTLFSVQRAILSFPLTPMLVKLLVLIALNAYSGVNFRFTNLVEFSFRGEDGNLVVVFLAHYLFSKLSPGLRKNLFKFFVWKIIFEYFLLKKEKYLFDFFSRKKL